MHSIAVGGPFRRPGLVVIGAQNPRAGNIMAQKELDVLTSNETRS